MILRKSSQLTICKIKHLSVVCLYQFFNWVFTTRMMSVCANKYDQLTVFIEDHFTQLESQKPYTFLYFLPLLPQCLSKQFWVLVFSKTLMIFWGWGNYYTMENSNQTHTILHYYYTSVSTQFIYLSVYLNANSGFRIWDAVYQKYSIIKKS